MFEDFDQNETVDAAAGRRSAFAGFASVASFGGLVLAAVALHVPRAEVVAEPSVDVTFETPDAPEPEAPAPEVVETAAPTAAADPRPRVVRELMQAPTVIPDRPLAESSAALAPIVAAGPVDGFLTGSGGGGRAGAGIRRPVDEEPDERDVPHVVERMDDLVRAAQTGGCRQPTYPPEARAQGVQGSVRVRLAIGEDGQVVIREISGDPVFHDAVRDCIARQIWRAAHLGDGTPVPDTTTRILPFRISNL